MDIDFMGLEKQSRNIRNLFSELGYQPRSTFNAMNGRTRLIFNDIQNERRVDIFLDKFQMCHRFDFSDRLKLSDLTLPLADLLLTKLQVYEITQREYKDMMALLKDHELGETDDDDLINIRYIAELTSNDWGLWRTINLNLNRMESALSAFNLPPEDQKVISLRISLLRQRLKDEPKSFRWKLRATVGDGVRWYELPEKDEEVVDSRAPAEKSLSDS